MSIKMKIINIIIGYKYKIVNSKNSNIESSK